MSGRPELLLSAFVAHPDSSLLEWIAYHRAIGVGQVHLFVDRKGQRRAPLLEALAAGGAVTLHPIAVDPDPHEEIRNAALRAAGIEATRCGGYGLFLAPDEYFRINSRARTIQSLMRSAGGADVLSAPVRIVGTGGQQAHVPGPVLDRVRASGAAASGTTLRSVVRLGLFGSRTPEVPVGPAATGPEIVWVNGDGDLMPTPLSRLAWGNGPGLRGSGKADILKIPAPSVETSLLRMAALDDKHRPDAKAVLAQMCTLDPGLAAWSDAIAAQTAALLALPGVKEAQIALCDQERACLNALPGVAEDARRITTGPSSDTGALPIPADDTATDAPTAPDATGPAPDTADVPGLPPWFAEIHTGGEAEGVYTRLKNHAVYFVRRDAGRLFVTFDNLSNVNDLSPGREPWAYKFVRDNACSHLAVMARRKDWYRDPQLIDHLRALSENGFFRQFDQVFMGGTSMGGFAALAFSSLAPGATVLSFSPQTTLDETLVPWEKRFGMGRARDWSLPHGDCAFEIDAAARAFVFYDPFFEPDRRHIERLDGANVIPLKTWCSGHFSPVFLRRANLLKPIMQHALDGTLTPALYYRMFRDRRHLPWYRKALESNLTERGHIALAGRVTPAFRKLQKQAAE